MTKEEAIAKAKEGSADNVIQHVNYTVKGDCFYVSDWFDCDSTVESYVNGELNY